MGKVGFFATMHKYMKETTQQICEILENPELLGYYRQLSESCGTHIFKETTIEESFAEFVRFAELILDTSKNGLFDEITYTKRDVILSHVKSIKANLKHCQQYSNNIQQCANQVNSLIDNTLMVSGILEETNLFLKSLGIQSKRKLTETLSQTFDQYKSFLENIAESDTRFSELGETDKQVRKIQADTIAINGVVVNIKEKADQFLVEIEKLQDVSKFHSQDIEKILEGAKLLVDSIRKYEEEAEEKRLSIETFSKNIDEYKKSISGLENRAKAIVEKDKTINELIQSAEKALNLRSAEGISAAFASQYVQASSWKIATFWLSVSFLFVVMAIGGIVWLAWGDYNFNSYGISLIIARIVAVAITVTAATFCAKQYIKQKNIAEDYAYKAVLSKSIIAFTDKLNEKSGRNPEIVAEYLQKVLAEIHQDPLRQRNTKEEQVSVDFLPQLAIVKEIVEMASKK